MARYLIAGVLALIAVAVAIPMLTLSQTPAPPSAPTLDTTTQRKRSDVIMLRCNAASNDFSVMAYQGSTEAPQRRATNCPETLSLLLRDGFMMRDIGHFEKDGNFSVFTLVR